MARVTRKKWPRLLSEQPHHNKDNIFCYCFFICSVWDLYETARNLRHYIKDFYDLGLEENQVRFGMEELTEADVAPFIQEGTLQSSWFQRYNALAAKLDKPYQLPGTPEQSKTLREYFSYDKGGDTRCDIRLDDGKFSEKLKRFIALPGCPTMRLPEVIRPLVKEDRS